VSPCYRKVVTSDKKRSANKRNAQGSTGPGSVEGKAASRMNALKTGLYAKSLVIRGESQEEFDELVQQFNGQYHPVTPQARVLVDILIRNTWLLRRYDRIDGEEWAAKHTKVDNFRYTDKSQPTALAFEMGGGVYARIRKFADTAERAIIRALNQLDKLTEHFPDVEAVETASVAPQPVAAGPASPGIGFVPPVAPEPAVEGPRLL
jgi:hypothetical protein